MTIGIAWALFILGLAHIAFGLVRFRTPLREAVAAGFIGQFAQTETRRTAFWFIMCGPLLMLAGHLAIGAVARGELAQLTIIGGYGMVTSVVGIAAFPKSPMWGLLLVSVLLLGAGAGLL